jgi:hypothetical protein
MGKVVTAATVSLDGYIAGPNAGLTDEAHRLPVAAFYRAIESVCVLVVLVTVPG